MSEERVKILEMLANGKIKVDEAERLLRAVGEDRTPPKTPPGGGQPRYLIVTVDSEAGGSGERPDKVNVRIPLQVIRAGVKLAALMPAAAKDKVNQALAEKGLRFDLDKLRPEDLEELVGALGELTVDINDGRDKVRVYCE